MHSEDVAPTGSPFTGKGLSLFLGQRTHTALSFWVAD